MKIMDNFLTSLLVLTWNSSSVISLTRKVNKPRQHKKNTNIAAEKQKHIKEVGLKHKSDIERKISN